MTADHDADSPDFDQVFAQREQNDANEASQLGMSSATDATCMYEESESVKKLRDIAFAIAAIQDGAITERKLAKAASAWTIHGSEPLSDHLVSAGLLTAEQRDKITLAAETKLGKAVQLADARSTGESANTSTLGELDPNGGIIKMLGLSVGPDWSDSEQNRVVTTRYKILRRIGQGGMGVVWLARDERLGRLVAIKEIRSGGGADTLLNRFRREAQVTGRLEHPSIVPVHQLAEDLQSGKAFYVMRFLGKRTLDDAISEYHERREAGDVNPMHLHRLLTSFVTVCQAIAFAHSRNIVHRDLKPENIALDDYGQVIVLDWGLAKATGAGEIQELMSDVDTGDAAAIDQTTAGQVLGTPMYMAPEQAAGRSDEIDATTDIYGLGALLFAILTGVAPHEKIHASLSSTSKVTDLLSAIVSNPAPSANNLVSNIPAELEAICAKAMANRPYARYASAVDLAEDIQNWMAGEPVSALDERWTKRAMRWVSAHRRLSQLVAVLATIVIVSAITLGVTSYEHRQSAQLASFEQLKTDARELELRLHSLAQDLAKDARFMAALPPIQGIIRARSDKEDKEDSEQIWQARLQTIFNGLLGANPNYLSANYLSTKEPTSSEMVRVERFSSGSSPRTLPPSRLSTLELTGFLKHASELKPGDVMIEETPFEQSHHEDHEDAMTELILTAAIPIYGDIDGAVFGLVAIETDLEQQIRDLLVTTIEPGQSVYVVSGEGTIVLHYSRKNDFQQKDIGKSIGSVVPGTSEFFVPDSPSHQLALGEKGYATWFVLDQRHSSARIGFLLMTES
jgi:serine/threonine protein kinase